MLVVGLHDPLSQVSPATIATLSVWRDRRVAVSKQNVFPLSSPLLSSLLTRHLRKCSNDGEGACHGGRH